MITEFCPTHSTYLRFPPSFSLLRPTSRPFLSLPLNALYWHLFFYLSHKLFSYLTPQMYHLIQAHIPVFLYAGLKHSSGRGGNQGKERGRNKKVEHRRGGRGGGVQTCHQAAHIPQGCVSCSLVPTSTEAHTQPCTYTHSNLIYLHPWSTPTMVPTLPAAHVTQYRKRCCWPFLAHSSSLTHSLIYLFICSAVFTASGLLPDFVFLYE